VAESAAAAVRAILAGGLAVVPTDTVYGLACTALAEDPARRLYALKGRTEIQPSAVLFPSAAALHEHVPELGERARRAIGALLPGPYTLVLENPAHRFPWLNRARPEAIGVRVPAVSGAGLAVLEGVRALVATSANLPGGPDPRALADVPRELIDGVDAVVDGGALPGVASTVVDLTGAAPLVLREGAVPAQEALARIASEV